MALATVQLEDYDQEVRLAPSCRFLTVCFSIPHLAPHGDEVEVQHQLLTQEHERVLNGLLVLCGVHVASSAAPWGL